MRKLAEFVQLNCTSSISLANFRLQARVINNVYKGFDAVNNDDIYVSDPKTLSEELAILLLLRLVRCHDCMHRFYRLPFVATSFVDAAESRKPVRQVGTDKKDKHRSE